MLLDQFFPHLRCLLDEWTNGKKDVFIWDACLWWLWFCLMLKKWRMNNLEHVFSQLLCYCVVLCDWFFLPRRIKKGPKCFTSSWLSCFSPEGLSQSVFLPPPSPLEIICLRTAYLIWVVVLSLDLKKLDEKGLKYLLFL